MSNNGWIRKCIASGAGSGYFPWAPGTAGSVVAVGIAIGLHYLGRQIQSGSFYEMALVACIIFFTITGVRSINALESEWGQDPSKVVVDEWVGYWISIIYISFSYVHLFIAFVFFRIFDIWKPFGIRRLETVKGGFGVILDDIAAGILANVCTRIVLAFI